jgi:serine/threonine-protein kinase
VVADFGVARAIETAAGERLTETGLAVGTAVYMSPEQAGGGGRLDGRSDIYSLGCVLFEMLAGEPPFGGGTQQAIVAKHMQAPVPDLRVVRTTVSPALQRLLEKALAKVPADRFATAGDFSRALEATAPSPPSLSWRRPSIAAAAIVLGVGLAAVIALLPRPESGENLDPVARDDRPRIAVLYFDALSGDSAVRRIAGGITEELIYELSGVRAFRVISRNGVAPYRDRRVPIDSLVAALRVNTLVEGSVQRWGVRLRVRVQLIDAASDTYIDSLSLERPMTTEVTFERTVAQELAAGLRQRMGREARLKSAPLGTTNPTARELARKAQHAREDARVIAESRHAEDLGTAREALGRADSLLVLAQAADPGWQQPRIARGWVAVEQSRFLSGEKRIAVLRRGLQLAEDAVRQDANSPSALELRGVVRMELVNEIQAAPEEPDRMHKAEMDLRRALDLDSTLTRAWTTLGDLLWTKGSTAEAAIAARRALREDTYLAGALSIYNELFFTDLMLGNFQEAAEWCRRGQLTLPSQWRFVQCELTLMRHDAAREPDPDSAWSLVRRLEQLDPPSRARAEGRPYHPIYRRVIAATIGARRGQHARARAEIARARRTVEGDSTLSLDLNYDEAYLRLVLGEREHALRLLSEYLQARPLARDYLARDPLLQDLRRGL